MGRNDQLVRQWKILRKLALSRFGYTLYDLSEMFQVSVRTIRRDLDCLNDAGFHISPLQREQALAWKLSVDEASLKILALKTKENL